MWSEGTPASGEAGFTLIELVTAATLFIVVLGATVSVLDTTNRLAPRDQERPQAIIDAQVGLDRMIREVREASPTDAVNPIVVGTTTRSMEVRIMKPGPRPGCALSLCPRKILIDCNADAPDDPSNPNDNNYKRCVRNETTATGAFAGSGEVIIDRVVEPVFEFTPSPARPRYVRATIVVPARGERRSGYDHDIRLQDGVYIRNADL